MATYSKNSPYYTTPQYGTFLDLLEKRPIPFRKDDTIYVIERAYQYRPDLLAYDLYGSPRLRWVCVQRNPDQLEDPIYDFKPGVTIQLPKKETLLKDLGI